MTYNDIVDEVRGIIQEMDPLNTHVSNTVMLQWANACTLQLMSLIGTYPKATIPNLVAANTLVLPANTLRLDYASITDGTKKTKLATIDFTNFARVYPDWENQATGKPTMLVRMSDTDWMMFPQPNAAYTGVAITAIGSVLPTPATDFNAVPPVNLSLHTCYAHYISWKCFLLLNNPERAGQEFQLYDGLRKLNTRTATSTTGSLQSLKMPA